MSGRIFNRYGVPIHVYDLEDTCASGDAPRWCSDCLEDGGVYVPANVSYSFFEDDDAYLACLDCFAIDLFSVMEVERS